MLTSSNKLWLLLGLNILIGLLFFSYNFGCYMLRGSVELFAWISTRFNVISFSLPCWVVYLIFFLNYLNKSWLRCYRISMINIFLLNRLISVNKTIDFIRNVKKNWCRPVCLSVCLCWWYYHMSLLGSI